MKKSEVIWKVFMAIVMLALLVMSILIFRMVKNCCFDCDKSEYSLEDVAYTIQTTEFYDSLTQRVGTLVWIDTLSVGQKGNDSVVIWNYCPTKKVNKPKVEAKKSSLVKKEESKVETITYTENPSTVSLDTCLKAEVISPKPDTLKLKVEKIIPTDTSLLFSQTNVIPVLYDLKTISNKTEFCYQLIPDLHIEESFKKAKAHLWFGTSLATAGAVTYAATMLCEVPTYVNYNGLDYFDPSNKYYDHNVSERARENKLKWTRGLSIGAFVLGDIEIVHGILLLKGAKVTVNPQTIRVTYDF
jgi:hypothetical protein